MKYERGRNDNIDVKIEEIIMTSLIASLLCCLFVSGLDELDRVDLSPPVNFTPGSG